MPRDMIWHRLLENWQTVPVYNTHCHHLPDQEMQSLTLSRLLQQSYVGWTASLSDVHDREARRRFFDDFRCNSYSFWLFQAIEALYPQEHPLNADSWEDYDRAIRLAHETETHHLDLLRDRCRYQAVILDQYRDPGSDNGHPEIFHPTFRCDAFFSGYDRGARDHDGVSPYDVLGLSSDLSLDEYLAAIRLTITQARDSHHAVAIKVAMAYERDLLFLPPDRTKAERAFGQTDAALQDVRAFHDLLMDELMSIAADLRLPVQIHTGLGQLDGTAAMNLRPLISRHQNVRFDLFHGSFPWTDDILALAHVYQNVYIDLCWLPIISPARAIQFIREATEVSDARRIVWGCDTWTSEESYGALLAVRHCLAAALAEQVASGYYDITEAERIGCRILGSNTRQLMNLN